MNTQPIVETGDVVRSFDFEDHDTSGPRACYVEGRVVGLENIQGCTRYVIVPTRRVFGGEDVEPEGIVFPPVNGTRTTMGWETNGVAIVRKGSSNDAEMRKMRARWASEREGGV